MNDRFTDFKARAKADQAYREAYAAVAATDPARALLLPHPDDRDTDPAKALETIRGAGGPLRTDAVVDLKG